MHFQKASRLSKQCGPLQVHKMWLYLLLINFFILPRVLPPLNLLGFRFEWQIADFMIFVTGLYLFGRTIIRSGKIDFISGIDTLDKVIFLILIVQVFSSIMGIIRFSNSFIFAFASLLKSIEPYILYFFIRAFVKAEREANSIINLLVNIGKIIILVGIIQIIYPNLYLTIIKIFYSKSRILFDEGFVNSIERRVSSLLLNPNKLANFIIILFPLMLINLGRISSFWKKVYYLVYIVATIVVLIYTLSREGYLGFATMLIYLIFIIKKYRSFLSIKYLGFFIILILVIISLNFSVLYQRIAIYTFGGNIGNLEYMYETSSFAERFILWKSTLNAIYKNLLYVTGIGLGSEIVKMYTPAYFITGGDPHNTFLRTFLETGILGFLLFWYFIIRIFKIKKMEVKFERYKFALQASTIGLLFSGILGDSFQDFEISVVLFALIGLIQNMREGYEKLK